MTGTVPAPINSGGAITYSITPALPTSLTFGTDGSIQGTPTAAAAAASYTVTATNPRGSVTFPLTIAVGPAPLLHLGHTTEVQRLRFTGSRLLSQDGDGHWQLQDFASGTVLASGDATCAAQPCGSVDMAGNVMVDATPQGLELRGISDGHVTATVPGTSTWWQLASDGSYLVTGDTSGLTVYSTASSVASTLSSRSGDYSKAIAYAAPGQVQVAVGPAGSNVIETVAVVTGSSVVGPAFLGTFSVWFQDGGRFLTTQGTTVRTYSSAGAQQDITQLSTVAGLSGQGGWFWTNDGILSVYQVGASQSPVLTQGVGILGQAIPSGSTIGVLPYGTGQVTVVDLSGSTPRVSAAQSVPTAYLSAYAATSASAWVTGNMNGVVFDGTSPPGQPRYLSLGEAWSIAGGTSYVSVATASGSIFIFDPTTNAQIGTISFPASQLSASLDGTVLAAAADEADAQYETDRSLNVYSLPSGSLIHSFSYAYPGPPQPTGMSLSGSGTFMGQTFLDASGGCGVEVIGTTGGTPVWCSPAVHQQLRLSPDGTEESLYNLNTNGGPWVPNTTIYHNGTVTGAVSGAAIGWLDNGRLLVNSYVLTQLGTQYAGAGIYDPTGKLLVSAPVPELQSIQLLTGDTVYSPERNIILSLTQGQPSWASANTASGTGAAAGSEVVFVSGTLVLAQPAVTGAAAPAGAHVQELSRRQP
jgi:hypothetical protein